MCVITIISTEFYILQIRMNHSLNIKLENEKSEAFRFSLPRSFHECFNQLLIAGDWRKTTQRLHSMHTS